jgi:hypothetical protein
MIKDSQYLSIPNGQSSIFVAGQNGLIKLAPFSNSGFGALENNL